MPQVQDGWQEHELTPDAWLALVDVARTQQLAPLLYWQMRKWLPESPPGVQKTLRDLHMMASIGALLRERALRQALAALNAAGVRPGLFKGSALAFTVYPTPACRPMGDLDLWVPADEMPRAQAALESLGYVQRTKAARPLDWQQARDEEIQLFGQESGQGLIELHWGFFPGEWSHRAARIDRKSVQDRLRPTAVLGHSVCLLAPEDALIQLAVHTMISHHMTVNVLRGLVDIALLSQQGMDWAIVVDRARAWRLVTVVGCVLDAVVSLFPEAGMEAAAAALRSSSVQRWLSNRRIVPDRLRAPQDLPPARQRFLSLLPLVDRPMDVAALLARSVWPERQWLDARYGRAGLGVRLRHAGAVLRGKV